MTRPAAGTYLRITAEVVSEDGTVLVRLGGVASLREIADDRVGAPMAVDRAACAVARTVWDTAVMMGHAGD